MKRKKLRYRIAESLGYELVKMKKRQKMPNSLESNIARVLDMQRVNCVVDVGANTGQYGSLLRKIGYSGRIISFEPVRACFDILAHEAASDPNWSCRPCALGREDGTRSLNVMSASVFSSFLDANAYAARRFDESVDVERVEEVEVRRLDSLFGDLTREIEEPRVFLKMDTQGFDLEVFAGASTCLDQIVGLQSELSLIPIYKGMPGFVDAIETYRRHDFEVTHIHPVSRDSSRLVLLEVDCVMSRRPTADRT